MIGVRPQYGGRTVRVKRARAHDPGCWFDVSGVHMMRHGELIARGRQADVYGLGADRVLRRNRIGRDCGQEGEVMRYVAAHGYPVPAVHRIDGAVLVMERIDGLTMLEDCAHHPEHVTGHVATLVSLHDDLHRIPAPAWLPAPFGHGAVVIHLDLHPANIILSPRGPRVIDWESAARGTAGHDLAQTWLLLATSDVEPELGDVRRRFVARFESVLDRRAMEAPLPEVVRRRMQDPAVTAAEGERLRALLRTG